MPHFNSAYAEVFKAGELTLGLMTPLGDDKRDLAVMDDQFRLAAMADELGFGALWVRDVPLMIPQGDDNTASNLDDPFIWLAGMAGATKRIALGTAAAVLTLRHPLHLAKTALSMDRLSKGRFILGLGSGDRPAEFSAFRQDPETRAEVYRERWALLRSALNSSPERRAALRSATGGFDIMGPPAGDIPMVVVGSARQSLQWIAGNADAWATYHREQERQQGRIGLWRQSLEQKGESLGKPFIQSLQLELKSDPDAVAEPLELGLRTGRNGLRSYLASLKSMDVSHAILNLTLGQRHAEDVIEEIGRYVLPGCSLLE
ncbi:TIGR03571 family LLM class oxidoreductase [Herbaspirillum chlorophenolicum]|uniref:TIGR03571 family LLM class oxidoreductase n=1 Tax=Herbaspirillum chlorophenolicum TaxID=211589 RepID=UPI00067E2D64|nr:TIGR03571 family LLM class oxidoreductase [Herbaspirillum chlorophenolicum]